MTKTESCPICSGTGMIKCPNCHGSGEVVKFGGTILGDGWPSGFEECPKCDGDGKILCGTCRGSGVVIAKDKS